MHFLKEKNNWAGILSKLANIGSSEINLSFIQETMKSPNIENLEVMMMEINNVWPSWISPIAAYFEQGALLVDPANTTFVKRRVSSYSLIYGTLYRRGLSIPCEIPRRWRICWISNFKHEKGWGSKLNCGI